MQSSAVALGPSGPPYRLELEAPSEPVGPGSPQRCLRSFRSSRTSVDTLAPDCLRSFCTPTGAAVVSTRNIMARQMEVRIAINRTSHHFGSPSPSHRIAVQCPSLHIGIATHRTQRRIASHRIVGSHWKDIASHRIATCSGLLRGSRKV